MRKPDILGGTVNEGGATAQVVQCLINSPPKYIVIPFSQDFI